jgi:DNA polymerase I-like protein with 3'-5' exonuclease and polymerase domains
MKVQSCRIKSRQDNKSVGYGRTAEACARQCQEEGVENFTEAEAQQIINTIFATYPGIPQLQEALRARVANRTLVFGDVQI